MLYIILVLLRLSENKYHKHIMTNIITFLKIIFLL